MFIYHVGPFILVERRLRLARLSSAYRKPGGKSPLLIVHLRPSACHHPLIPLALYLTDAILHYDVGGSQQPPCVRDWRMV